MSTPNTSPIFVVSHVIAQAAISAANTNLDGTGTIVTVATGATDGTRIDQITIKAEVATTAGMVRLFIDDGGGLELWREEAVSVTTPTATVKSFAVTIDLTSTPLILPSTYILAASTEKAEAFNVFAFGASF